VTDRQFYNKALETETKRTQLNQVREAKQMLLRTKKLVQTVQKIENLIQKQALLVALRELRNLKKDLNQDDGH